MNKKNSISLTFEPYSILRDIWLNLWTIVLAFLIGIMGVYVAQRTFYTPQYRSSATFCVQIKQSENSLVNLSQCEEMAEIMTTVLVQPTVKKNASNYVGISFEGSEISATQLNKTNFITLSVTSDNPKKAFELLWGVIATYNQVSDDIFTNAVLKLVSNPTVSTHSINGVSIGNRTGIGFGVAFVDLCVIIFLSLIRDTVKDRRSFGKKVDAELIGTIPHENKIKSFKDIFRKKKKGLLINESLFMSLKFSESYHQLASQIKHYRVSKGDKVFAVTSVMENEGKTTAVANIALSLASNGYKVLVFDLDMKKPALFKIFEKSVVKNNEFSDVITGRVAPEDYELHPYRKTSVYMAVNSKSSAEAQRKLESRNLERVLSYYREKFDFILIDTAPMAFDANVTNITPVADRTVLVVRTDIDDAASINDAAKTINTTGGKLAGCILNDVYPEFAFFGQSGKSESETNYGGYGHYRYGRYGKYGKYSHYGKYGKYSHYGKYGKYGSYSSYGKYNVNQTSDAADEINDTEKGEE